eukprot:TRINITY_DN174_c0_g1_i1.p1 TRINITY_DN174_c0_g1~~TRINITY_DN174_c0_g1_i1.p1  ORF type:complete len:380 (+),score=60.74 TRINITY_DN174_c0_g1_i1:92-1231(+)
MCQTADDCNNWGRCTAGVCDCINLFEGDTCNEYWLNLYPTWAGLFWAYTAVTAVLNAIILVWCCVAIGKLVYSTNFSVRSRKSLAMQSFVLVGIASLLRFIYILFDPHNSRRVGGRIGVAIFYDLPIMFWFASSLSIFLYWIELQSRSRLNDLPNIKRLRPVLYVLAIMVPLVLLPLTLWRQLVTSTAAPIVYNVIIIIMILVVVVSCLYSGRRLLLSIKRVMKTSSAPQYYIYLRSVTYFMISMMASLITMVILLLISSFVGKKDRVFFLGFHFTLRCLEFWLMITMVLFLDKNRPKSSPSSDGSKDHKSISGSQDVVTEAEDRGSAPPREDNSLIKAASTDDVGMVEGIVIHSEIEMEVKAVGKEDGDEDSNDSSSK